MRAKNCHTAGLVHLAPGEVGEVDEKNGAVIAWIKAGLLVAERAPEPEKQPDESGKRRG